MSEFAVGMKVVCVDDRPNNVGQPVPLIRGQIYTITALGEDYLGNPLLNAVGVWPPRGAGFHLWRFRPLEPKCAQLFRDIAAGKHIVPDDEPIRVAAPKEGWTVESLTADILRRAV